MVNAWNVGELDQMVLPPCHYGFQVYTRELSESERVKFYYKKHDKGRVSSKTTKFILDNDNIPETVQDENIEIRNSMFSNKYLGVNFTGAEVPIKNNLWNVLGNIVSLHYMNDVKFFIDLSDVWRQKKERTNGKNRRLGTVGYPRKKDSKQRTSD
jgi:hypothetical protein